MGWARGLGRLGGQGKGGLTSTLRLEILLCLLVAVGAGHDTPALAAASHCSCCSAASRRRMQAQNSDATKFEQRKVRKEQPREPTTHADEFRANRSHAGIMQCAWMHGREETCREKEGRDGEG